MEEPSPSAGKDTVLPPEMDNILPNCDGLVIVIRKRFSNEGIRDTFQRFCSDGDITSGAYGGAQFHLKGFYPVRPVDRLEIGGFIITDVPHYQPECIGREGFFFIKTGVAPSKMVKRNSTGAVIGVPAALRAMPCQERCWGT